MIPGVEGIGRVRQGIRKSLAWAADMDSGHSLHLELLSYHAFQNMEGETLIHTNWSMKKKFSLALEKT